jgi:hypothetical protein
VSGDLRASTTARTGKAASRPRAGSTEAFAAQTRRPGITGGELAHIIGVRVNLVRELMRLLGPSRPYLSASPYTQTTILAAFWRGRDTPMRERFAAIAEAWNASTAGERRAFVRVLRELRARGEAADARDR